MVIDRDERSVKDKSKKCGGMKECKVMAKAVLEGLLPKPCLSYQYVPRITPSRVRRHTYCMQLTTIQ
uniref:Ferredoxin n=1 Tax=Caenorhabditis tropicalis TaxID=1561998 RepID=A0A1I7UQ10_9PELO